MTQQVCGGERRTGVALSFNHVGPGGFTQTTGLGTQTIVLFPAEASCQPQLKSRGSSLPMCNPFSRLSPCFHDLRNTPSPQVSHGSSRPHRVSVHLHWSGELAELSTSCACLWQENKLSIPPARAFPSLVPPHPHPHGSACQEALPGVLAPVPLAGPGFWREMFKRDQLLFAVLWLCLTNIGMTPTSF